MVERVGSPNLQLETDFWQGRDVFIKVNEDGFVLSFGSSRMTEDDFVIKSEELENDFFDNPFSYQLVNGVLIFNDEKVKQDEQDREDFKNQPTREELLEAELVETQLALTEIYELLLGGVQHGEGLCEFN